MTEPNRPPNLDLSALLAGLTADETSPIDPSTSSEQAPPAVGPPVAATEGTNGRTRAPGTGVGLDWGLVRELRQEASERLANALHTHRAQSGRREVSREEERELGREIITSLIEDRADEDTNEGKRVWSPQDQEGLSRAVYDALFRHGRLQPLVDSERVENIEIEGSDPVLLEMADGVLEKADPVADSDAELVDTVAFLASRAEGGERSFNESNPSLHLKLEGGARLAAMAWVVPRPVVVIRRHRLRNVTLEDLIAHESLTPACANFLTAAVRAKRSVVVAGQQGAGKTTLVRALCAAFDPDEKVGTFETERELFLEELPHHNRVFPVEARPGTGERGVDGRQAGEYNLDDAMYDSFRFILDRYVVGEVRGREVLAMIKAMQSGAGTLSTTHATSAELAINKLVTCALEAGPQITEDYARRAVTENINLVVQVQMRKEVIDGQIHRRRWVSEVLALEPGEDQLGYSTTHVFRSIGHQPATAETLPDIFGELVDYGFDRDLFEREALL